MDLLGPCSSMKVDLARIQSIRASELCLPMSSALLRISKLKSAGRIFMSWAHISSSSGRLPPAFLYAKVGFPEVHRVHH